MAAPTNTLRDAMRYLDEAADGLPDGKERITLRSAWMILAEAEARITLKKASDAAWEARRPTIRAANFQEER